jgi:LPXTG-motif cell wall-anchored protein
VKRLSAGFVALFVALTTFLVLAPRASAAPAQDSQEACFPGDPIDYPPSAPGTEIELSLALVNGHFDPGASGVIGVTGAVPGLSYCGIVFSTPIVLQPQVASGTGGLSYIRFAVPADFQLNAMHHLDLYRQRKLVGAFDFCVKGDGDIGPTTACAAGKGKLPRTGVDHLMVLLRWAALALGLGAFFTYLRRRREQAHRPI